MDFVTLIINLLIIAVIISLLLFLAAKAPIDAKIKEIITWVIYVVAVLWLIAFLLGGAPPLLHSNTFRLR